MQFISSPDNKFIKLASSLKIRKYREAAGLFLVEGWRSVNETLTRRELIEAILAAADIREELDSNRLPDEKIMIVEPKLMKQVCSTDNPQGIAAIVRKPQWAWGQVSASGGLLVYLDRISDPGNLGSILEAAGLWRASGIDVARLVDLYNPKVVRSTMGAILNLPVFSDVGPAELVVLKEAGFALVSTDVGGGQRYYDLDFRIPTIIILGSEAHGVSRELKDISAIKINIPITPGVESLNVAAACAIIVAEARRQRQVSAEH